ncbi:MAG: DUF2461 family protein [Myxococcota bacterium]
MKLPLTDAQQQLLHQEADRIRSNAEFAPEIQRRHQLSRKFRAFIERVGLLQGKSLDKESLAELIRLLWEIQQLNPVVLPRLMGSYEYYKHFKDFQGSRDDFVAHMRVKRSGFTGGYEGADLDSFSQALRTLLAAEDDAQLAKAYVAFAKQPGVQRAFGTGALMLYAPDRYPLVNGGAIAPFRQPGPLQLSKARRKELRDDVRPRIGNWPSATLMTFGWIQFLRKVKDELGCEDFLELDRILWELAGKLAKVAKGNATAEPVPAADGADPVDLDSLLDTVSQETIAAREAAEREARELIESKLGTMTSEDLRHLLELLNRDVNDGRVMANRFSPAFTGSSANKICERPEEANRWIERLWRASEQEVPRVLEEFWEAKELPGSGRSFPTAILYLRDPHKYQVLTGGLYRGYARVDPKPLRNPRKSGERYLQYSQALNDLRNSYGFAPQATDALLARATHVAESTEPYGAKANGFQGFSHETFEFLAELAQNNNDAWFQANRHRFKAHVREPLRDLVTELGERVIAPMGDAIERTPKAPETLAKIRKNVYGKVPEGAYWPHYWAAFHRLERSKSEDFQLFVYLRADQVCFGFGTASATREDRRHLADRILRFPEVAQSALDAIAAAEFMRFREVGDGYGDESVIEAPANPEELASLVSERPITVDMRLASDDSTLREPEALVGLISDVLRRVYPLFALATADDPAVAMDAFRSIEWEGEAAAELDEGEDDVYSEDRFLEETLLSPDELAELRELLEDKPQMILYGPPGTGKTWVAERLARYLAGASGTVRTVQFHPSYGYEDFIEGIRPEVDEASEGVRYLVKPGIFRKLCEEARRRPKLTHVLIIDEINRGNLPRIFGELLYALERRGDPVDLPISGKPLRVPSNVILIGTMNSADHSIALVDVALRRRFQFYRLDPDETRLDRWLAANQPDMRWVARLLGLLNEELEKAGIERDMWIGHSHFMQPELDENRLARIWDRSILPTLEEYFYGRRKALEAFDREDLSARAQEAALSESDDEVEDEEDEVSEFEEAAQ